MSDLKVRPPKEKKEAEEEKQEETEDEGRETPRPTLA